MPNGKVTLGERMAKLETDVEYIKHQLDENKEVHQAMAGKLDKFIDTADGRYALKNRVAMIEKVVYGAVGMVLIGFITVLINYAFKGN